MKASKLIHKNTVLLLLIFLIGIIGFVIYINGTFKEDIKVVSYKAPTSQKAQR